MAHLALYGNVGIPRMYCQDCERYALVVDGIKQCCDKPSNEDVTSTKRIIEPEHRKRLPPLKERMRILRLQADRCLYCERRFGSSVWYKGRRITLRVNYDHVVPFDYSRDNSGTNFVATCHICNHWKSDKIFNTLEEIQVYVTEKWQRVETDVGKNLRGMRDTVSE